MSKKDKKIYIMDEKIKAKWLEALRSGEYKQCRGQLVKQKGNAYSFCCLGVLCNIHAEEIGNEWQEEADECITYLDYIISLPIKVREWAGIDSDPRIYYHTNNGGLYTSLSEANDKGLTFKKIADIIEEQL